MTWRQIATAPKDGARIDLWAQERERCAPQRITDCFFKDGWWRHSATIHDGEELWDELDTVVVHNPTHWQPLPDPPEGTQ